MKTTKAKHWWLPFLISLFLIIVGVWVFFKPTEAFISLAYLFLASLLISGAFNISFALFNIKNIETWWWFLIMGVLELAVGITMLFRPAATALGLILYVGFWLAFKAMMTINYSFELKKLGFKDWWLNLVGAVITLIFSFLMVMDPEFGMWGVIFLTGTTFVLTGVFGTYLALQLKNFENKLKE